MEKHSEPISSLKKPQTPSNAKLQNYWKNLSWFSFSKVTRLKFGGLYIWYQTMKEKSQHENKIKLILFTVVSGKQ